MWTERADRDLNPTFGHELVEGMRQLFGWITPPQSESSFLQSIRAGFDTPTEERLRQLSEAVGDIAQQRSPDPDATEQPKLCFGIRLPATFMRFEGEAAFEKTQRVALFLDSCAGGKGGWQ